MSLAYKLWEIGSVLTKDDIKNALQEQIDFTNDIEPIYLNIDFNFDNDKYKSMDLSYDAIPKDKLFISSKIGGTSNAYYLYPNIIVKNSKPIERLGLLENTLEYGTIQFCNENSTKLIKTILSQITKLKEHSQRSDLEVNSKNLETMLCKKNYKNEKEKRSIQKEINNDKKELGKLLNKFKGNWSEKLLKFLTPIAKLSKNSYIVWFSINGKTFYEIMPEVFDNWFNDPFIKDDEIKSGFDVFSNNETKIGYKPDVKVFSYDQYHKSLKYRIIENLPLSLESAKNIKFAWMYILENLVFYYKGLEYIIIPNLLYDDDIIYKTILERLKNANINSKNKRDILRELRKEEDQLKKKIEKLQKKKQKDIQSEKKLEEIEEKRNKIDLGVIREFQEQLLTLDEHLNSVAIDYIFTSINRTNLSFEIKGSIEDVIPSQISKVVTEMHNNKIDDLVRFGKRDMEKTLLQDYFNRDELYFVLNRSKENNSNKILEERLYLAKLLLTDMKIKFDDLLKRIEFNRLYKYDKKKRVDDKDRIQEWIKYSSTFISKENNLINFLKKLNKIKE
ncbi:MAG: hypothetical protein JW822_05675 [Spirochaetales bacterium]|nr:hypothetical protein [Spirochaetales bacterium]